MTTMDVTAGSYVVIDCRIDTTSCITPEDPFNWVDIVKVVRQALPEREHLISFRNSGVLIPIEAGEDITELERKVKLAIEAIPHQGEGKITKVRTPDHGFIDITVQTPGILDLIEIESP